MTKPTIVIQAGHVAPLEPGFEGGTGTTRESEFSGRLQSLLALLLTKDGRWDVRLCGGKTPDPRPFSCLAFLSLHGDGSGDPKRSGFCYGYPEGRSVEFAGHLRRAYEKISGHPPRGTDNYTRNLAGYYGFSARRISAPFKVVVEHGFLTNPQERAWLFNHLSEIAEAHYRAICKLTGRRPIALVKPRLVSIEADGRRVNVAQSVDNPALLRRIASLIRHFREVVIRRVR